MTTDNPQTTQFPELKNINKAKINLNGIATQTPLMENLNLSQRFGAKVFLKREDFQMVRSYKIRGAYNKISSLTPNELQRGLVCASAGNHAQGFAYSCNKLKVHGQVFMPSTTPKQKVQQVRMFGKEYVQIVLHGDSYDDAYALAMQECQEKGKNYIHAFDDMRVIEGQATVGLEILQDAQEQIDYLFVPIGGGGLMAGIASYFKELSPHTKLIGVEPAGAPAMKQSIANGQNTPLVTIDKFVDGAAVKQVGDLTFNICKQLVDDIVLVPEGLVCVNILKLYNEDAIVVEPAGSLSIAALELYADRIKGKNVVCVVSGSNNDITRTEEIKERALLYQGLKHYFILRLPQRAGAFKEFLNNVLGPTDDITHFQYTKKNSREKGPAVLGVELASKDDFKPLLDRMKKHNFVYEHLNDKPDLFQFLV